ncbi:cullin CUL3 [Sugiyamaella lignohabitans]|uniref:Cullin CUL3 n=1 Tax=Sugiyamaella lignohabitans TaxID=796027 RepID=A0A167EDC6_9ASCO|nr:cullin CUL3 [Sugiyamaella lignohabitans]ANB13930.1 cullin CUL3 [Sugiyamaella lignohabitans]
MPKRKASSLWSPSSSPNSLKKTSSSGKVYAKAANIRTSTDLPTSSTSLPGSGSGSSSPLFEMQSSFPGPDLPISNQSSINNSRKLQNAIVGNRLLYGRAKPQTTRRLVIKSSSTTSDDSSTGNDNGKGKEPISGSGRARKMSSDAATKYYEETMEKLKTALEDILSPGLVGVAGIDKSELIPDSRGISQEELYRGVENLYRYNKAAILADLCLNTIEKYAKKLPDVLQPHLESLTAHPLVRPMFGLDSELSSASASSNSSAHSLLDTNTPDAQAVSHLYPFLRALDRLWKSWSQKIILVRNIFFYLDRAYLLPPQNKKKPIWDTGVDWFSKLILQDDVFNTIILTSISQIVNSYRVSLQSELSVVENISRMLASFKDDRSLLENEILSSAKELTNKDIDIKTIGIESFVDMLLNQITIEQRLGESLNFSTKFISTMVDNMKALLLKSRYKDVFANLKVLLDKTDYERFQSLYTFSRELDLDTELLAAFRGYVINEGTSVLENNSAKSTKKGGSNLILSLLELYHRCLEIVRRGTKFPEPYELVDSNYEDAFRRAFAEFLNKDRSGMVAEKLAKYADELLRSGIKACSEKELDEKFDELILIFRCVQGKDVFEAFYKKDFAKRLLQSKSGGLDFEKSMISKLKVECGPSFTSRLETMIKDMELSKTYATEFREQAKSSKVKSIAFNANILTQGHWPTLPETKIVLPPALVEYEKEFEKYYLAGKARRKLSWQHGLGNCIVKANFPRGTKELVLNLIQAVVLLQFNTFKDGVTTDEQVSYSQMKQSTQLDDSTLRRTLQSLACGKVRILVKDPATREVDENDTFKVNLEFSSPVYKIKVSQIAAAEAGPKEAKKIHEDVNRDRQMEIQAAIIRLMKARKKLKHVELVQQTIDQIKERGLPNVQDIKKNIEKLLEREYLERVDNTDTYIYV